MRITKLRHTLIGKVLGVLLGVFAVSLAVLAIAFSFKRDLDRQHDRFAELGQEEFQLQRPIRVATLLLADLSFPQQEGGPGASKLREWRHLLTNLAKFRHTRLSSAAFERRRATLEQAAAEIDGALAGPLEAERLDDFTARLAANLREYVVEIETVLDELQATRLELTRRFERASDVRALLIFAVGLGGFAGVCFLTGRFFLRLARDLRRLKSRAGEIAGGNYGDLVHLQRKDEVGELAEAVNTMASDLSARELEIETFRNRLFQNEKMFALGTFASGIAHEIANPIHAISTLSERMKTSLSDDPSEANVAENVRRLEMILEQIDRMGRVIHEISEFARSAPAQKEPTSINEVFESAIRLLRFDRRFRGIEVTAKLSPDVPVVNAVGDHLTQIAINILLNAADAIDGEDGEIVITSSREGNDALITVSDNGHGMSKEAAEMALDPFYSTKQRGEGTGLGLAMCKKIIEQHDGALAIASEPDRGTTVSLRIPSMMPAEAR